MICLDTNAIIAAINVRPHSVRRRLREALIDGVVVGIPAIALCEMWYGVRKSARPQDNAEALALFLTLNVTPWQFDAQDAEEAGDIRGALLVTANTTGFARVPGLAHEDWCIPA
jgi:tRNA(fMet)-specific endonuclease VapC